MAHHRIVVKGVTCIPLSNHGVLSQHSEEVFDAEALFVSGGCISGVDEWQYGLTAKTTVSKLCLTAGQTPLSIFHSCALKTKKMSHILSLAKLPIPYTTPTPTICCHHHTTLTTQQHINCHSCHHPTPPLQLTSPISTLPHPYNQPHHHV